MIRALLFGRQPLLEAFTWRGTAIFVAFLAALAAWTWSGVLLTDKTLSFEDHAEYLLSLLQRGLLTYTPVYILVGIADRLAPRSPRRRLVLAAALVTGVLLAVQVRCAVDRNQMYYVYGSKQMTYCSTFPTWRTYIDFPSTVITPLALAGMAMIFIFGLRRDAELVAALNRIRAAQVEARRTRIEADIEAMHSRVDPERLFATLEAIRGRYEAGLGEGEEMLDRLIADLRQAAGRPADALAGGSS